jgi:hypothetical protein
MHKDNALYFPYIKVPKTKWFIQALLYWDKLYSVVPTRFLREPEGLGFFMRRLGTEGLLKYAVPTDYIQNIENFEQGFVALMQNSDISNVKDLRRGKTMRVHGEKMGLLGEYLTGRGLIEKVDGPGGWLDVEYRTANLFLGYLARRIGESETVDADPITDEEAYLRCFLSAAPNSPRMIRTPAIQKHILDNAFPVPEFKRSKSEKELSRFIDELGVFKNDNKEELTKFRRWMQDTVFEIALKENELDRNEMLETKTKRMKEDREQIIDKMRSRGWSIRLSKIIGLIGIFDPTGISGKVKSALELGIGTGAVYR